MTQPRPIGGEMPFEHDERLHTYLTDSGRSSLRLILQSGFARRKFLLPDFLCDVIPRVFEELGVPPCLLPHRAGPLHRRGERAASRTSTCST